MEKDRNNSVSYNSSPTNDEDEEKSIVGKFKSIISSTPLSKWFRKREDNNQSTIRRRDEDEDEEIRQMQPPSKRVKLPVDAEQTNSVIFNTLDTSTSIDVSASNKTINHFPEPVAGPSGVKFQKLLSSATSVSTNSVKNTFSNREFLNGHNSDSEESTSGYSSVVRIGSKEQVCQSQDSSKQTSPLQNKPNNTRSLFQSPNTSMNRSLFTDRTLSPNINTSMTSRRPSFNASTFGSPNFIDNTITTEKIINSPFYNGRTIYGGASAYGRRLGRSARDLRTSLKKSVQIKPVNKTNENGNLVLGKTARKILDTLEQYSSPVNDAKKIPTTSKRFRPDGYLSQHVGARPYMVRGKDVPSNKELQVPTVSDLLKMKQKMKLQQSTEVVRQIAISSKSNLNNTSGQSTSTTEKDTSETLSKDSSKDQNLETNKATSESQVKTITPSLPVTSLPKFNVAVAPESSKKKSATKTTNGFSFIPTPSISMPFNSQPVVETVKTDVTTKKSDESTTNITNKRSFKFSDPLVISENYKSIVAINNFKFSEPLCKIAKIELPKSLNKDKTEEKVVENTSVSNGNQSSESPNKTIDVPLSKAPEKNNGPNSFDKQFKMSAKEWECSICMIRNKELDAQCVACTAPKPSPKPVIENVKTLPSSFGNKFSVPSSMWECTVCMVRNEKDRTNCVACKEPNTKVTPAIPKFSFGKQFEAPPGTWNCPTCLVKNNDDLLKCAACETAKKENKTSDNLSSLFKVKENEWECKVCMVRNKSSDIKCQCCEATKPGSSSENSTEKDPSSKPVLKFNFGFDKVQANTFTFGIPADPAVTLPKPAVDPSTVFGENAKPTAPAAKFSFGIPAESKKEMGTSEAVKPATEVVQAIVPAVDPKVASENKPSKETVTSVDVKLSENIPSPISQKTITKKEEDSTVKPTTTADLNSSIPAKPIFSFGVAPTNSLDKVDATAKEVTKNAPPLQAVQLRCQTCNHTSGTKH
ncbi:uncharacterized protein [Leptinotarsa decemlineata]|uniref:uncharacterized protein n=1 Tax=Leptinotarsa decemlineata TaxID=7539 RepID=UPI003D304FD9